MGRKQGVTEQQLLDLADFETSSAFTEVEKLVLRYAAAMTQTPVEVPDELFAGLRQHFDPRQMVELTSAIAWENYRARFDHAFGIEPRASRQVPSALCLLGLLGPSALAAPNPAAASDRAAIALRRLPHFPRSKRRRIDCAASTCLLSSRCSSIGRSSGMNRFS